ncbi:MAG: hypothetical protein ABS951_15485 [Solibacillus sp.]
MNVKGLYIYILIAVVVFVLFSVTGCQDRVLNVEDQNIYEWQKYMNEDEFKQLQPGMNYMDVVEVAGGAGTEIETSVYEWRDEILLTQAYVVYFEDGKLMSTEIIEKRGSSTR